MSYIDQITNTPNPFLLSAFGEQSVADNNNRFDIEFLYDKQPDLVDEVTDNGTVTFDPDTRNVTLALTSALGTEQAAIYGYPTPYTPAYGVKWDLTGTLNLANIGGGTASVFLRESTTGTPLETVVEQANWTDLDGQPNLTSGVNWNFSHIFQCDFQSLKVGSLRMVMVQNGIPQFVHKFDNDNVRASGYWQQASLPPYWRIYNTGGVTRMEIGYGDENNGVGFRYEVPLNGAATMSAICGTVKSQGGRRITDMVGLPRTANRLLSGANVTSGAMVPLISINMRDTFNSIPNLQLALAKKISVLPAESILLTVYTDTVLGGSPSFANVDTSKSAMEFDIAATSIVSGTKVFSDYIYADATGGNATGVQAVDIDLGKVLLWNRKNSPDNSNQPLQSGILTVAAQALGTTGAVYAGINWEEIR